MAINVLKARWIVKDGNQIKSSHHYKRDADKEKKKLEKSEPQKITKPKAAVGIKKVTKIKSNAPENFDEFRLNVTWHKELDLSRGKFPTNKSGQGYLVGSSTDKRLLSPYVFVSKKVNHEKREKYPSIRFFAPVEACVGKELFINGVKLGKITYSNMSSREWVFYKTGEFPTEYKSVKVPKVIKIQKAWVEKIHKELELKKPTWSY